MLASPDLQRWLVASRNSSGTYRHLRLNEDREARAAGLKALGRLVREAHRDALERLERLYGISLDPLDTAPRVLPNVQTYPDQLDTITLQGYLGEIFAGLIAENYEPHGREWEVPAFLFRAHAAGAQALERRRQLGEPAAAPGRTGDDAVAFIRDGSGRIVEWLYAEAKCTKGHDRQLIRAAHKQLSTNLYLPVDLVLLIEILEQRGDRDAREWADALRLLLLTDARSAPPRSDMLVYVCGRRPKERDAWISVDAPEADYTGGRPLEAAEAHLVHFDDVLRGAYTTHNVKR